MDNQKLVVVMGSYFCGKTMFITTLSGQTPTIVDVNHYIDWNATPKTLCRITFDNGTYLFLLEWPGATIFHPLETKLRNFIIGMIITFDGSKPETSAEAKAVKKYFRQRPICQ